MLFSPLLPISVELDVLTSACNTSYMIVSNDCGQRYVPSSYLGKYGI